MDMVTQTIEILEQIGLLKLIQISAVFSAGIAISKLVIRKMAEERDRQFANEAAAIESDMQARYPYTPPSPNPKRRKMSAKSKRARNRMK